MKELEAISARYRDFLDKGKTERECAAYAVDLAEKNGYLPLERVIAEGTKLEPGAKVYTAPMGKAILMVIIGSEPMDKGINIIGAHIDSPRIDVKQNPQSGSLT